jgi:hypothetical protein
LIATKTDRAALLAFCDVLDDSALAYKLEYVPMCQAGYPFADRMAIKLARPFLEQQIAAWGKRTIGGLAHEALKKATRKDFGKDAAQWRKWIESRKA